MDAKPFPVPGKRALQQPTHATMVSGLARRCVLSDSDCDGPGEAATRPATKAHSTAPVIKRNLKKRPATKRHGATPAVKRFALPKSSSMKNAADFKWSGDGATDIDGDAFYLTLPPTPRRTGMCGAEVFAGSCR